MDTSETTLTLPKLDALGSVVEIEGVFVILLNVVEIKVDIGELLVKFLLEIVVLGSALREDMVVKKEGVSLKEDEKLPFGLEVIWP
jgi:hypothetical protein